ncbi:MAG: hypothetical protein CMI21_12955 [Opitutae bacterium]|nr:hypothetical protein [Opitutae bacterium]
MGEELTPDELKDIRERFRFSGSYQEAAVVGLVRAILLAQESDDAQEREIILRSAMRVAFLERPGIYFDHASGHSSWAREGILTGNIGIHRRGKLGSKATSLGDDFVTAFGLEHVSLKLQHGIIKHGLHVNKPIENFTTERWSHYRSFPWIDPLHLAMLKEYYEASSDSKEEIAIETFRKYNFSIHQSIRSGERLLPYLMLAERVDFPELSYAYWFETRPELEAVEPDEILPLDQAIEFLDEILYPCLELGDDVQSPVHHSLGDLIEDIKKRGDGWMVRLHDFIVRTPERYNDPPVLFEWDSIAIETLINIMETDVPSNLSRLVQNLLPEYMPATEDLEMAKAYGGYPEDYREAQSFGSFESQSTDDLQEALDRIKEELRKREESSE